MRIIEDVEQNIWINAEKHFSIFTETDTEKLLPPVSMQTYKISRCWTTNEEIIFLYNFSS